ncbi:hypothetical protein MKX01_022953 [Papaver californicum]|nr:hypothetical protein MKX01_022953 [Papaver californicum]
MGAQRNYSRPSFFKVMGGDFEKKLKIPINFVGNFNGVIPYDSILRTPSGCWNVNVREEDGGLSFRKGWPDFVEVHYLGHVDFVTMEYIGNSQFAVKLYGINGCEKVLPSTGSNGVKSNPSRKRKEYGETSKGKFTNYGSEFDQHKYRVGDIRRDSFCSDKRNCGLLKCDALKRKSTVIEGRTRVDQTECLHEGKPYFLAIWTENKKYQMLKRSEGKVWFYKGWKEFTEYHSLRDGHVLRISYNGNSQFCVRITNVMERLNDFGNQKESNSKKRCRLSKREGKEEDDNLILTVVSSSWSQYLHATQQNNGKKISDETRSSYFGNERTPSGEPVVKQELSEDTSNSPAASKLFHKSSRRTEGNERVAEVTKLFKSETQYPFFAVCMRNTYLTNRYLHIPNSFAKKHLPRNIKNVMVQNLDNKVRTLGYWIRDYAAHLSAGWTSLRRDLGLTEGDVCVFELLEENDAEMRVSVFREIDNVLTRI